MQTNLINALSALLDALENGMPTTALLKNAAFLAEQYLICKGHKGDGYLPLNLMVKQASKHHCHQPVVNQAYLSLTSF